MPQHASAPVLDERETTDTEPEDDLSREGGRRSRSIIVAAMMAVVSLNPLDPDDLREWTRRVVTALLSSWPDADEPSLPPRKLREAVVEFAAGFEAVGDVTEGWSAASGSLVEVLEPVLSSSSGAAWMQGPVGSLLRGLYASVRRSTWSDAAREVYRQCEAVRQAAEQHGAQCHVDELLAALMVVQDATTAIEGYAAAPPFLHVDEAYLAKYGLLQALQAGLDAVEAIGACAGLTLNAWRAGGEAALEARNIVAGHPIGGTMRGESWHHFNDRATAHDKAVIRVMSFSRREPDRWTGQTISTEELMGAGLGVMADLLRTCAGHLADTTAGS